MLTLTYICIKPILSRLLELFFCACGCIAACLDCSYLHYSIWFCFLLSSWKCRLLWWFPPPVFKLGSSCAAWLTPHHYSHQEFSVHSGYPQTLLAGWLTDLLPPSLHPIRSFHHCKYKNFLIHISCHPEQSSSISLPHWLTISFHPFFLFLDLLTLFFTPDHRFNSVHTLFSFGICFSLAPIS